MKENQCSLAEAMRLSGVPRNILRDFIGICELRIIDKEKYERVVQLVKEKTGFVKGSNLQGIHDRYLGVLETMKENQCSLAEAMRLSGVPRNTLRDFYRHLRTQNHRQRKVRESGPIG
ncbi:hypothetical protein pdam_00025412 [Pocillopora damicornis]|uniref:Uncharacterized protein n=1 Tax=Pocillopora damicornis TaxID=46731 RepID=A0A3M6TF67_POCDA|nr:hypothetical protein pdam_00025412 [Pocillopora damicornis]